MSRTHGTWQADTPFTDAKLRVQPFDLMTSFAAATDAVLTRNAAGDWSFNQVASKTNIYAVSISAFAMERAPSLGAGDDLQEQFGTAAGVAGPSGVANTGSPADVSGRPPFTGASQLVPVTGFRPKGFKLTDVTVIYQTATNPLTAITCRIDKVAYADNVALGITSILASGANGLATAVPSTGPRVIKVPVGANAAFNVTDNAELIFELSIQTAAACTCKLYGFELHGSYNFA